MQLDQCTPELTKLVRTYVAILALPGDALMVTTSRETYRRWIGRMVPSSYGGAYCYLPTSRQHAVLINLERIDQSQPRAVELVVAEELVHMRDRLDGDTRRHAHHGHDRIAHRVASLTGASLEEIRATLKPVARRPFKYVYACPSCGVQVKRRRRGTWSCGRCSPRFDKRFVMHVVQQLG
jgi:hypothetical protein